MHVLLFGEIFEKRFMFFLHDSNFACIYVIGNGVQGSLAYKQVLL